MGRAWQRVSTAFEAAETTNTVAWHILAQIQRAIMCKNILRTHSNQASSRTPWHPSLLNKARAFANAFLESGPLSSRLIMEGSWEKASGQNGSNTGFDRLSSIIVRGPWQFRILRRNSEVFNYGLTETSCRVLKVSWEELGGSLSIRRIIRQPRPFFREGSQTVCPADPGFRSCHGNDPETLIALN